MANSFQEVLRLVIEAGGQGDVDSLAKQLDQLQAVSAGASKETLALVEKLKTLAAQAAQIQSYTRLKGEIAETAAAIEKESAKLVQLRTEMASVEKPSAALERSFAKQQATLDKLLLRQNVQSVELQKTAGALNKAGLDTDKLATSQVKLNEQMSKTQQELGATGTQAKAAGESVSGFGKHAASVGDELKSFALKLTEVALLAEAAKHAFDGVKDFVTESVDEAAALEDSLQRARALTQATAEQMEAMKAAVEGAAQSTRFTSNEAAVALVALSQASGDANTAVQELVPTLRLAQAAGIETAAAATTMVQTLAEFGLGADHAAQVADLLAKAAKSGGLGLDGLAEELAKTAPLARQLGMNMTETVAIMAALGKEGVRGRLAASGLKEAFEQLADPTSKFSSDLRVLGINTTDFNEVIVELAKRGEGARRAIEDLSVNARPAIELLVADGGARIRELQGDLANAGGAAKAMADDMEHSYLGAQRAIAKSWEELKESLFGPVLIPLRDAIKDISDQLDHFAHSKDFEQIKVALKEMFGEGAKAAVELFHAIDFHGLALNIKSFVGAAKTSIAEFRNDLAGIIATVKQVYEAFRFAFALISTAIHATATAVALLLEGLAKAAAQAEKIAHPFGGAAEKIRQLDEASAAFAASAEKNYEQTGAAVADMGDAFDKMATAASDADAAQQSTASSAEHAGKAAAGAGKAAAEAAVEIKQLPPVGTAAAHALEAAAEAADKLAVAQQRAAEEARVYRGAIADLGIVSQADLIDKANKAAVGLEVLQDLYRQGKGSIDDLRRGYEAYAQAQRAAVANSDDWRKRETEASLRVKAAQLDLGAAAKATGDAVVDGAQRGAHALDKEAGAGADAAQSLDHVGKKADEVDKKIDHFHDTLEGATFSLGSMSQAAAQAFADVNKFALEGVDAWMKAFNRVSESLTRQQGEVAKLNASLDEQLSKYDPLTEKIKALQQQFGYVDPNALRAIAEKQQRLDEEAKRQQDEAQQARHAAAKAALAAVSGPAHSASGSGGAVAPGGPAAALANTNLAARSSVTDSHHVIELRLPPNAGFTDDQVEQLTKLIGEFLARQLSTMTGRRF